MARSIPVSFYRKAIAFMSAACCASSGKLGGAMREMLSRAILMMSAVIAWSAVGAEPVMRVGFVSDTHVGTSYGRCWKLKNTLELFRREKCDLLVNGGDIADANHPESYAAVRRIYDEAFAGEPPPPEIFAYAWHDVYQWKGHPRDQVNGDAAACWPDLRERLRIPHHHTDRIVHRGYTFLVFPQWMTGKDGFPSYDDYEKSIAAACRENPGKPVFVVDHVPPRGTVPGSVRWGDGRKREILDRYPQVVVLSGHTHGDVCDDRLLWQGGFTVINAGCQHYWQDDAAGAAPTNRPAFSALTIDVMPDRLLVRRFDVREGKEVAAPWIVPVPTVVTQTLTRATAEIVVEPGLGGSVDYAADELGQWLGKALGGVIPRVAKPTPGKTSIVLGDGALARAAGIDTRTLKRDGFRIRTAAGRIYIAGQDEKDFDLRRVVEKNGFSPLDRHAHATVFGVYEFLERFVGVRFYFPHELGVVVPRADSITVPLTDLTVEPRNLIRTIYWGEDAVWLDGDSKSKEKNRAFGLGWLRNRLGTYKIPCCHGQNGFQYTERFAKTHPEYFQMRRDGSRCLETEAEESKIDGQARQLCHSSAVWDELYEDVKAYLTGQSAESRGIRRQNNPNEFGWNGNCVEGKYVDIMAQDGMMRCFCSKCQAAYQDKPEFATDLIWGNTKRLAERLIADGVPGYVVQMSYNPYRDLPSFDLPTNVLVMVAENGPWSVGNPALMSRDCGRIEGWAKKTGGRVWLWNYPGKWGRFARPGVPASVPRAYAKFYKAVAGSIFGAFAESETDRAIYNYLNHYVFGRVMWNPDVDVDALLDEHYRLMFGAAAPEMKAFYEGLEDKWINEMVSRENKGTSFYEMPTDLVQWQKVYSPEVLKAWNGLFETGAAKLKAGSDEARRLSFIRSQFLDPLVAESEKFLADLRPETELARRKARPNTSILVNGDIDGIEHWIGSGKFDPTTSVTGGGSLMLTTVSNRVTCIQKLGLKLERDTRYRISYFMKQTDLAPNAAAIAVLSDYGADSYARTWQTHPRNAPTEGHDWIFRSYEVRTGSKPDKDAKSSFGFFLTGAGTAWFDDVRVEKIP